MCALCCFVLDYHQDILNLSLQEFSRPDVVNIAEHADPSDLGDYYNLSLVSCERDTDQKFMTVLFL